MIREAELERGPDSGPRIVVVREPSAFAALRPEWTALLADSDAGPFNAWEWLYPWFRHLGGGRTLHLLTARDPAGRLLGVLPLGLETRRVAGRAVRRLGFLGETHVGSDYLDVVARGADQSSVVRAFAEHLRARSNEWDLLELSDVDSTSPTLGVFRRVFAVDPFQLRFNDRFIFPYEVFDRGEPFEAFLERTGQAQGYRSRYQWVAAQPGFRIDKSGATGPLEASLAEHLRLRPERSTRELQGFHREATSLLAEKNRLRLYTLRIEGRAVASAYALLHRGAIFHYQAAYEPGWRSQGAALVLVGESFKDALGGGLRELGFLRAVEPCQREWATRQRYTISLRIFQRDGAGAWLGKSEELTEVARSWVRRVMPAPVAMRLWEGRRGEDGR